MRRVVMIGAAGMPALLAVLLGLGFALQERGEPEPDEWARFADAPQVDGLAIAVEREPERVTPGQETRYRVAVGNRSETAEVVTVRVTVPPWLAPQQTPDGEVGDGFVEWPVVVAPNSVAIAELSGVYAAARAVPEQLPGADPAPVAGTPQRVTLTACALDPVAGRPIVCATDAANLQSSPTTTAWWLLGGLATLVVAAGTAAATLLRYRRRGVATGDQASG